MYQQNIILGLVKGLNFALIIYFFSRFFRLSKKTIPNPIIIIFNTIMFFSIVFLEDPLQITVVNQHFKYIFNLVVGFSIWTIWYREFLNNEFLQNKHILRDHFFIAILALCGHLVSIPTIIMFMSLCLYMIFSSKNYFCNFKQIVYKVTTMALIFGSLVIVCINLPGFVRIRQSRVPESSILNYSITHFVDFSVKFFEHITSSPYEYMLLIVTMIGFILLIIFRKKGAAEYLVIFGGIFVANFVFQYALLTCGTTYYDKKSYWFISHQLTSTFMFYLIICCNVLYGYLFRLIDKTVIKIIFVVVSFLFLEFVYPMDKIYRNTQYIYQRELIQQVAIYKINKLARYYELTDSIIYIPGEYYKNINLLGIGIKRDIFEIVQSNLKLIYRMGDNKQFERVNKKIINEKELFSEEELVKPNFKKLYDANFVMQMPEPIFESD